MLDYETLKVIWWVLIGLLIIGFAVADGFDMGVICLLKVIGKTDIERRVILNTVGPHWDGNQVWFITAIGAIFAAWPVVYAVAFSGLYWLLLLMLFALFFRPVGFEYRSKIEDDRWRNIWDVALTIGGFIPALLFGVIFGNLFLGLPFTLDVFMRSNYSGSFLALFNPFSLLCGMLSLSLLVMQGANYLQMRTVGDLFYRSCMVGFISSLTAFLCFLLVCICLAIGIDGYIITQSVDAGATISPFAKEVEQQKGAWLINFKQSTILILIPFIAFVSLSFSAVASIKRKGIVAFLSSSIAIACVISSFGLSLFPFVIPSSVNPVHSLTIWDVVSSEKTLLILFWVAMVFMPIILSYTLWAYYKMWGKITTEHIEKNKYGTY